MRNTLLILDLDETLVHSVTRPLDRAADFRVGPFHVYKRPHVDAFLNRVFDRFEVAVWTSAGCEYAEGVVDGLMGGRVSELAFLWSADRCTTRYDREEHEHYVVKKLKKVKRRGFDLSRVIMLDDSPSKHEFNYGNLLPLSEYTGAPDDDELIRALEYLDWLRMQPDVRRPEKRGWRARVEGNELE